MRNLIHKLQQLLGRKMPPHVADGDAHDWPPKVVSDLVVQSVAAEEDDYSCDECDQLLARFTEAIAAGEPASAVMPRVQKHLDSCSPCREEFEALLEILNAPQA